MLNTSVNFMVNGNASIDGISSSFMSASFELGNNPKLLSLNITNSGDGFNPTNKTLNKEDEQAFVNYANLIEKKLQELKESDLFKELFTPYEKPTTELIKGE